MWYGLAFLSALLIGFYDISKKHAVKENSVLPVLFLNTLFCSLIFIPLIICSNTGIVNSTSFFHVRPCTIHTHLLILVKALIVLSSWLAGYYSLKYLPITIAGPINATRPLMVLLGALVIFGEKLNWIQSSGVIIAILSFLCLSQSGKKEGISFKHNRWVWLMILTAFLGALSGLYDKYLLAPSEKGGAGADKMAVQAWFNIYQCLIMAALLILLKNQETQKTFRWKWSILLVSITLTMADMAYFYALTKPEALIAVVSMIRRSSVIVSFTFGAWIFKERNLKSKAINLLMILLSMLLLWLGSR